VSFGPIGFLSGFLLGLAGSIHCATVCGSIASSLLLTVPRKEKGASARCFVLLKVQIGRLFAYVLLGALVGWVGSVFGALLYFNGLQTGLRIAAACLLVWVGCSIAGIVPHGLSASQVISSLVARAASKLPSGFRAPHPVLMGVLWGFAPCGMVYTALLNAMLAQSPIEAAEFMGGFGMATIPPVAAAAFGIGSIAIFGRTITAHLMFRRVLGGIIAMIGLGALVNLSSSLSAICLGG
jgi:uncharacterized protein